MAFVVYHCVYVNDVTDHIGYAATPDNSAILKPINTLCPALPPDHHVGHGEVVCLKISRHFITQKSNKIMWFNNCQK